MSDELEPLYADTRESEKESRTLFYLYLFLRFESICVHLRLN